MRGSYARPACFGEGLVTSEITAPPRRLALWQIFVGDEVKDSRPWDILMELKLREEERILSTLPGERRWGLLELVRAIDYYFVYVLGLDDKRREEEIDSDRWDLYMHGQTKAVSLFVDHSSIQAGPSLTRSTPVHQGWADAVIQSCGRLSMCEMILNLHRYGSLELSMPSPRTIHATVRERELGIEPLEAEEFLIFSDMATEIDQHIREQLLAIRPGVKALMGPLVSPWQEHFIQYDTIPEIDSYFHGQGHLWSRAHYERGQGAFPPQATFGGLPFELYQEAVVHVIGWALKHIAFCGLLLSSHKDLDIRNLLTVTTDEALLRSYLSAGLDITESDALQVLDTLKLTPQNLHAHPSEPGTDIAPFLNINSSGVVYSIAGSLGSPLHFMLTELNRRYPKDWDRAVNGREEIFREELYHLFPTRRFAKAERPLILKHEGAVATDIDAAILDTSTGTLGLFQLKWQDPFGSSMRKRNSKMMNFLDEANRWVSVVSSILSHNPRALDHLIGEGAGAIHDTERILLFVVGRHFSHFSGGVYRDSRAAWGTWPQMLRLFKESYDDSDPITWLHKMLQEQSPSSRTPIVSRCYEMQIGEYLIRYDPVSAQSGP